MKILGLQIENLRAIRQLQLTGLQDMVVIAGPNGCGKSCIFDAIRLLKSSYGGYQPNEWQQWFGEFQINLARSPQDLISLFQDRNRPVRIKAELELTDDEKCWLRDQGPGLIETSMWDRIASPDTYDYTGLVPLAARQLYRQHTQIERDASDDFGTLCQELAEVSLVAELVIKPNSLPEFRPCVTLEMAFSIYEPQSLGIIDYHGSHRNYQREQIGNINLNIESEEERLRQHALYNYSNKYSNIKSTLAMTYVRDLLAKAAGSLAAEEASLTDTLRELFQTFFPGKRFVGPVPDQRGGLSFPVQLETGATHDINELSSGEKELLYGYLRLRDSAPRHSVLLIDEPELHLNPGLIRGLPRFYRKHLGQALGNQIWLVTHSDAFLRETVDEEGLSVFHMQPCSVQQVDENQVRRIRAKEDLERAIIDLVGDLATYRPGAKVVIFEGGGDSEFDLKMTCDLFPEFRVGVNTISGGEKRRVRELHNLLEQASKTGAVSGSFFSIVDQDSDEEDQPVSTKYFKWDRYHIENYLLEPRYLLRVTQDLDLGSSRTWNEAAIEKALGETARESLGGLLAHRLRREVNREMVRCINLGINPQSATVGNDLYDATARSLQRLKDAMDGSLRREQLHQRDREIREALETDLKSGNWRTTFKGREILARFVGNFFQGIKYEYFRNLVIARMREDGFQPEGMQSVVRQIIQA